MAAAQPALFALKPMAAPTWRACMHNLSGIMAFENTCQRSSGVSAFVAERVGN